MFKIIRFSCKSWSIH